MAPADELVDIEHRFWDASSAAWGDFYRRNCTADAVFVFGPTGPLDLEACAAAVDENDRPWEEVHLSGTRVVALGGAAAVLTYRADARQAGTTGPVRLYVGSAYALVDGRWKMAFHQQTPAAA